MTAILLYTYILNSHQNIKVIHIIHIVIHISKEESFTACGKESMNNC